MDYEIFLTQDGYHSVLNTTKNISYHSKYGALQESEHIFINAGLKFATEKHTEPFHILEVGFGTGLNALLTCIYSNRNKLKIHYTTIEKNPLPAEIYESLNYTNINGENVKDLFLKFHYLEYAKTHSLSIFFSFHKIESDATKIPLQQHFHCIYFDAFAPDDEEGELWDEKMLNKLYDCLHPEGCLVTFCAKGTFKRSLKKIGFRVEILPGPPHKREMVRAIK
jgi:tRNA U34 5-methylaminomethyl-2-thiouridine-forming methyltransferase MnmC